MGSTILSTKNQVDSKGLLNKLVLPSGAVTKVYEADKDVIYSRVDLNIITVGLGSTKVTIWIAGKNEVPGIVDLVEHEVVFDKNAVFIRTDIEIDPTEAMYALSDNSDTVLRITGFEDRTP